jgi:hypothetical protein
MASRIFSMRRALATAKHLVGRAAASMQLRALISGGRLAAVAEPGGIDSKPAGQVSIGGDPMRQPLQVACAHRAIR